jgi:hypothetical protein
VPVADVRKIRVMVSSRSLTTVFGGVALAKVREHLQTLLQPSLIASGSVSRGS